MKEPILTLFIALLLDLLLGDPDVSFHPVRLMGHFIEDIKGLLKGMTFLGDRVKGVVLLVVTGGFFSGATWLFTSYLWKNHPMVGVVASGVILYSTIGLRSLGDEAMAIYHLLADKDLEAARKRLSRIVGRRTEGLNETEVSRATIESVAENFVDAVFAPIFYWTILGAWGAVLYRAVNTLDAMVGYKDDEHKDLGWASARADDLLNYIPSRLAPFFVYLASLFLLDKRCRVRRENRRGLLSFYTGCLREGKAHESPNSGIGEAAFSLVLNVCLGGPTLYSHGVRQRPFMNQGAPPPDPKGIFCSVRLLHTSALWATVLVWSISGLKHLL